MKRFFALLLVSTITFSILTSCATNNPDPASSPNAGETTNEGAANISTGLGIVTGIGSSKSAAEGQDGNAQVDSLIAVITLDSGGKITNCSFDAAQTKVGFDSSGSITADLTADIQTKNEKGANYGMTKASSIGKEWNEQAEAFAKWAIGKTVAEVTGLKTKKVDDSHTAVPDVAELTSSVTISVGDFLAAVEKAAGNVNTGSVNGNYKSGLGIVTTINSSKNASDADGVGQVDSTIAAVTIDSAGKIVTCTIDSAQTKVNFNANGELTSDLSAEIKSKNELGDSYGMKKASAIGKEWYEQAAAFAEWTIGKTIDEVKGIKTKKVDDNHTAVPDVAELTASVSITVGDYITAIEKAVQNAK